MPITSLKLEHFRNIKPSQLNFAPRVNLIIGDNGQGKTNLLEAIYFISTLRSFRVSKLDQLINFNQNSTTLLANFNWQDTNHQLLLQLHNTNKKAWLDDKLLLKSSQLTQLMTSLVFSSQQLFLFFNFPAQKRIFFDRYLVKFDESYLELLRQSKKISQQKLQLLKSQVLKNQATNHTAKDEIASWNQLLAANIFAINNARLKFIQQLNAILPDMCVPYLQQPVLIKYNANINFDTIEQIFEHLTKKINLEQARMQLLYGNHLDSYQLIDGITLKTLNLSSGQAKTLYYMLLFSIAEACQKTKNRLLLFLIDDILSDLDEQTSIKIISLISTIKGQFFFTSTQNKTLNDFADNRFQLQQGEIKQLNL